MYVESTGTGIAVAVKMFSVHLLRTYVVYTETGIVPLYYGIYIFSAIV